MVAVSFCVSLTAPIAVVGQEPINFEDVPVMVAEQGPVAPSTGPQEIVVEHIIGIVLNSLDKKPVARVLVSSGDRRMAAMTDDQGRFAFDVRRIVMDRAFMDRALLNLNVDPATLSALRAPLPSVQPTMVTLSLRRPGYLTRQQVNVPLSPDAHTTSEQIELKIDPESVIMGHVWASNGEPPTPGVMVTLRRKQVQEGTATWNQIAAVQTNRRGEYRFAEVRAGEYKIATQAHWDQTVNATAAAMVPGYTAAYYPEANDLGSATPIHIAIGQTAEASLTVRATSYFHIDIPVANATPGAGVNVVIGDDPSTGYWLSFNSQSQKIEGFLPNGAYDLRVLSFDKPQTSARGRVEVLNGQVKASPIILTPSGSIPILVREEHTAQPQQDAVRLFSGSSRLTPDGQQAALYRPALNLWIAGMDGQAASALNLQAKNNEGLALENVQEGAYTVHVQPFRGYVASLTSGGVDLLRNPLRVGPGGSSAPIEVTLRDDGATLTGTVPLPDGAAANMPWNGRSIAVACIPLDDGMARPTQYPTAMNNSFTGQNLAPGRYLVLAFNNSSDGNPPRWTEIEFRNPDVLRDYESKGAIVTLTNGQKAQITVPLVDDEEK